MASLRTLIVLDTVEYLRRGGRISAVSARMASVLNIKPIINVNHDGTNSVFHKSRSYSKAMDWVLDYVIETARDLKNQTIGVGYSSVCQPARSSSRGFRGMSRSRRLSWARLAAWWVRTSARMRSAFSGKNNREKRERE